MALQNLGSPCLFWKYAKQKAILKASCYVSVAIATDSVVLKITEFKSSNINLSLVTSICQMKFKYANTSVKLLNRSNVCLFIVLVDTCIYTVCSITQFPKKSLCSVTYAVELFTYQTNPNISRLK